MIKIKITNALIFLLSLGICVTAYISGVWQILPLFVAILVLKKARMYFIAAYYMAQIEEGKKTKTDNSPKQGPPNPNEKPKET